jgi:ferrochelatase
MNNQKHLVLLVNLGSPNKLTFGGVRKFLKKFLSDKRVINLPKLLWYPILYGVILSVRAKKLVAKYRVIWLQDNSPLIHYTHLQAAQLGSMLDPSKYTVAATFSYAKPYLTDILKQSVGYNSLTVIPLYPQYSSTTTAAVFDEIFRYYKSVKYIPQLHFINGFYSNPSYIEAVANKITKSWAEFGRGDVLVFSYHSLPVSLIRDGDSYHDECLATTKLLVEKLKLADSQYKIAFQSRFGVNKWLAPAMTDTVALLAKNGIKKIDVVCPGFVCDCLETLEEIAIMNKEVFMHNGGEVYNYIECLNDDIQFTKLLHSLVD